mmetsp:Transcript_1401/g.2879  ORF Transcript_1401/g.2879 Transcript_1401/m.2879 type:complete len:439 (-) Transcript_1401:242-1558(-)
MKPLAQKKKRPLGLHLTPSGPQLEPRENVSKSRNTGGEELMHKHVLNPFPRRVDAVIKSREADVSITRHQMAAPMLYSVHPHRFPVTRAVHVCAQLGHCHESPSTRHHMPFRGTRQRAITQHVRIRIARVHLKPAVLAGNPRRVNTHRRRCRRCAGTSSRCGSCCSILSNGAVSCSAATRVFIESERVQLLPHVGDLHILSVDDAPHEINGFFVEIRHQLERGLGHVDRIDVMRDHLIEKRHLIVRALKRVCHLNVHCAVKRVHAQSEQTVIRIAHKTHALAHVGKVPILVDHASAAALVESRRRLVFIPEFRRVRVWASEHAVVGDFHAERHQIMDVAKHEEVLRLARCDGQLHLIRAHLFPHLASKHELRFIHVQPKVLHVLLAAEELPVAEVSRVLAGQRRHARTVVGIDARLELWIVLESAVRHIAESDRVHPV